MDIQSHELATWSYRRDGTRFVPIVASNDADNYLQPGDLLQPSNRQKEANSHF